MLDKFKVLMDKLEDVDRKIDRVVELEGELNQIIDGNTKNIEQTTRDIHDRVGGLIQNKDVLIRVFVGILAVLEIFSIVKPRGTQIDVEVEANPHQVVEAICTEVKLFPEINSPEIEGYCNERR